MTTNVQHQIQADRSGKIWINVSNNDPRLNINGIVARIRPVYNHKYYANVNGIFKAGKERDYKIESFEDRMARDI